MDRFVTIKASIKVHFFLPENTELALIALLGSVRAFHVRLEMVLELVCFGANVAAPGSLI